MPAEGLLKIVSFFGIFREENYKIGTKWAKFGNFQNVFFFIILVINILK